MGESTVATMMSPDVVTVVPTTPFKELVGTMIAYGLDALPVIDLSGRPVGVVTEADALVKAELRGLGTRPSLLAGARRRARWQRATGVIASELMTTPAVTVAEDTSLATAVRVLTGHGVRRVYVVNRTGHLVGVLTRQHLLRQFLRSDSAILADIERDITEPVCRAGRPTVQVTDGIVTLDGILTFHSAVERALSRTWQVPGVIAVRNNLRFDVDDLMITGL